MSDAGRACRLAALLATALGLAACASPFKGEDEPPPPHEQSGWAVDQDDTMPTQQEMDRESEGYPDQ